MFIQRKNESHPGMCPWVSLVFVMFLGCDVLRLHQKSEINQGWQVLPFTLQINVSIAALPFFPHFSDCRPISRKSERHFGRTFYGKRNPTFDQTWDYQALYISEANKDHNGQFEKWRVCGCRLVNGSTYLDARPLPWIDTIIDKIAPRGNFGTFNIESAYNQVPPRHEKQFAAFDACGNLHQFRRISFGVTDGMANFQRSTDRIIQEAWLTSM